MPRTAKSYDTTSDAPEPATAGTPERGAGRSPEQPPASYAAHAAGPPPRSALRRVMTSLTATLLLLSLGINVYLGIIYYAIATGGPREVVYEQGQGSERIVIVPLEGMLNDEMFEFARKSFRALEDDVPAAVILRIDCPGGYVTSSDRLWNTIKQFKEETGVPVIASFASMATSGGYYVAAPADRIVAEPTTMTGSIGVISMGFTVHEMLDKIGVTPEVVIAEGSTAKDQFSIFRPWTDEERQERQRQIEPAYERFVRVVHEGRGHLLTEAAVRERATGAVFSADEAKDLDLIDEVGYLDDAIATARGLANLSADADPTVTIIREPQGLNLLGLLAGRPAELPQIHQPNPEQIRSWMVDVAAPRMMYGVPMQ
ncbi:MAG: signal peptide peptidase SppA [Phycisphaeraceae bacterium]